MISRASARRVRDRGEEPLTEETPLLLLPGLLCDAALWTHQRGALEDLADIRIADFRSQDSIAAMAESVLALAPGRFSLAGLSMGGYVAFEVMRRAPERVVRLALLDTSARADVPEQAARRRGLMALAEKGRFKGVTPRLLPLLIHPDRLDETDLVDAVTAMAGCVGQDAFLRQQKAIMGRSDSLPDLPRITCPALVVCGRQDALTPLALSREMVDGLPAARFAVIEKCGHLSSMERPEAVTAELRSWLIG